MTLIKEHKKFIEDLRLKYFKVSREGVVINLILNNFKELAKKDRTFLEKSFTKNLNNSEIPKLYGDAIKFVINYKEDLEEVVRDG